MLGEDEPIQKLQTLGAWYYNMGDFKMSLVILSAALLRLEKQGVALRLGPLGVDDELTGIYISDTSQRATCCELTPHT